MFLKKKYVKSLLLNSLLFAKLIVKFKYFHSFIIIVKMMKDQENILRKLIEKSQLINSKVFNLTRYLMLALMSFNRDGFQYRELKTLLNISDGKLKSNLDYLEELEYIKSVQVSFDQRKVHIYMITDLGERELKKIINLITLMKNTEEGLENG